MNGEFNEGYIGDLRPEQTRKNTKRAEEEFENSGVRLDVTMPSDRRGENAKVALDMVGKVATEAFQEDLHPKSELARQNEAIGRGASESSRRFGEKKTGIIDKYRINPARALAAAGVVAAWTFYSAMRGVGTEAPEMEPEKSNESTRTEQKAPERESNLVQNIEDIELPLDREKTNQSAVEKGAAEENKGYAVKVLPPDIDGGILENNPPEEAEKNIRGQYSDEAFIDATKEKRIELGNKDVEEQASFDRGDDIWKK